MNTIIIDGLAFALPLFIIAIGGIFSERSGVTNLALEGFLGFGAFVGAAVVTAMTGGAFAGHETQMFLWALLFSVIGGANDGFIMHRPTISTKYTSAVRTPGRIPAIRSLLMGCSVKMP